MTQHLTPSALQELMKWIDNDRIIPAYGEDRHYNEALNNVKEKLLSLYSPTPPAMTAEEILSKHTGEVGIYLTKGIIRGSDALEAMEEYRNQPSSHKPSMTVEQAKDEVARKYHQINEDANDTYCISWRDFSLHYAFNSAIYQQAINEAILLYANQTKQQ